MDIEFEGWSGKSYEVGWHGLKKLWDSDLNRYVFSRDDVSEKGYLRGGINRLFIARIFWWNHNIPWD